MAPQAAPGSDENADLTPEQNHEIVCAVIAIRPEWQTPGIEAQLRQVAHLPYADVRGAFEAAAADRSVYTPMHLATAAQERVAAVVGKEAAAERRERLQADWRREHHEDVENRARIEDRPGHLARLRKAREDAIRAAQDKRTGS